MCKRFCSYLLRLSPGCGVVNWNSQDSTAGCWCAPPGGQTENLYCITQTQQTLTLKWQTMVFFPLQMIHILSAISSSSHMQIQQTNTGNYYLTTRAKIDSVRCKNTHWRVLTGEWGFGFCTWACTCNTEQRTWRINTVVCWHLDLV